MRTIEANGKTYKLGRNQSIAMGPHFKLRNYLQQSIPAPPESVNYAADAQPALGEMYLNDQLGDCVIAMMAHAGGVFLGNAGRRLFMTPEQITALYAAIGGYVPGDPSTDNGCDLQTALNYWQRHGLLPKPYPHKIKAWIAVDATNIQEVQTALWLFENLAFGVNLPDEWISPFPAASGFLWAYAGDPDPMNGHAFPGVAYNRHGVKISTWGMLGELTYPAIAKYMVPAAGGELYTVLSEETIISAQGKAPNGFSWAQLAADFATLG
jgi:hypothetical protein